MTSEVEILRQRIAELEAENAQLRVLNDSRAQLFETMSIAFILYEVVYEDGKAVDGRFLDANLGTEYILGLKREDFLGKTFLECFPGNTIPWLTMFSRGTQPSGVEHSVYYSSLFDRHYDVAAYSPVPDRYAVLLFDISKHKIMEQSLRESEERLQTIVENMPIMIIAADHNRRIMLWNHESERVTGYSAGEMIGRDDFMEILYPDEAYRTQLLEEARQRSGEYRGWEMEMTCKDGSRKIIAWSNVSKQHPVKGWDRWTLGVDVTPRVRAEQEIRRLNVELEKRVEARTAEIEEVNRALQDQIVESLRAQELIQQYADEITDLYNNAPCGYHSLDANGVFIRMNDTELNMLGYSREEVIGKLRMADLIPPEDMEKFGRGFAELKARGAVHDVEGIFILKDGTRLPILLNSTAAFDANGQFIQTRSTVFDITERKQTEALLQQYADELAELYNNAPFGYHTVDAKGIYTRINDTELKWLGYSREELVGRVRMYDLMTPESVAIAQQHTALFLERGIVENLELTVICKGGQKIPMLFSGQVIKGTDGNLDSIRVTLVDITERKQTEALLQQYADELADLYDNAPCGYYSLDVDAVIIRVNETQLKMLGYTREEVVGKLKIFDLYPPEQLDAALKRFETLRSSGAVRDVETVVRRKDGSLLPVLINSSVVYDDRGAFKRTRSTMFDMSELRKAQDIIMELNHHLEVRAEMLESANKELESFSYSVSHDLRAPLRAIDGFSRVVMESYGEALPEQGQHYLRRVRENAGRMGQLIDDLLDFSRMSRRPINKSLVSPVQIVLQVVSEIREQEPDLKAEIVVNEMPGCVADGTLLRQVYENLVGNAIKFTREQPNPRIEIGCDQSNGAFIYYVRDNGVGFDMTYVEKIFGVFQRLHSQSEYEGTGVGLATVQRIIHRHGGKIWAEATVNAGAVFYFTMGD